jgi:hypothetical protein
MPKHSLSGGKNVKLFISMPINTKEGRGVNA